MLFLSAFLVIVVAERVSLKHVRISRDSDFDRFISEFIVWDLKASEDRWIRKTDSERDASNNRRIAGFSQISDFFASRRLKSLGNSKTVSNTVPTRHGFTNGEWLVSVSFVVHEKLVFSTVIFHSLRYVLLLLLLFFTLNTRREIGSPQTIYIFVHFRGLYCCRISHGVVPANTSFQRVYRPYTIYVRVERANKSTR